MLSHLRHSRWLRSALSVALLCFALGVLAHAGHAHEPGKSDATHVQCDYCAGLGGLIDAPAPVGAALTQPVIAGFIRLCTQTFPAFRPATSAQARAPPSC